MKKTHSILSSMILFLLLTAMASCDKANDTDRTKNIVGRYTSGSGSGFIEIIVTKVDNTTISVAISVAGNDQTHGATTMDSETAFTLNSVDEPYFNNSRMVYSGNGTYSAGNIVITRNEKHYDENDVLMSEDNRTYTGSR